MRKIYLVRHAKSSWSLHNLPDADRPLNERGYRNSHSMSEYLRKHHVSPQLMISSPAIRAVSTALIMARALGYDESKIILEPSLYESTSGNYLDVIHRQEDVFTNMFLFAHNPTISEVYNLLGNGREEELSTCTVATLEFDAPSWKEIVPGAGMNPSVLRPSLLFPV